VARKTSKGTGTSGALTQHKIPRHVHQDVDIQGIDAGATNNQIYSQSTEPTGGSDGDLWWDTVNRVMYKHNGTDWTTLMSASGVHDNATTTYTQSTAPVSATANDVWIDTDDNQMYYYNGSSWVSAQDADISTAIAAAATAQATADGKVTTFYQASAPTAEGEGDLWVDTDDGNKLYRWNGSSWVAVQDADIAQALSDAATAQSTADGKIVSFYQTSSPTAEGVGDLWFDTDDNDKPYRWNGSTWVAMPQDYADWPNVSGTGKPADNADVTTPMKIACKINYTAFSTPNAGEIFFHGFDSSGAAANVDPVVSVDGVSTTLTRDYTNPNIACDVAYIVYDTSWAYTHDYVLMRKVGGVWTYFDNSVSGTHTVVGTEIVIGVADQSGTETVASAVVWGYGARMGDVPDIGADSTQGALENGTDMTSGYLWLKGAGAKINVGASQTYQSQGIQLEYNSGTPRMYIGDGSQKFMEFDGTNYTVGRDVVVRNTLSWNNDKLFMYSDYTRGDISTSGAGTSNTYADRIELLGTGSAVANSVIHMTTKSASVLVYANEWEIESMNWRGKQAFAFRANSGGSTTDYYYVGFGYVDVSGAGHANNEFAGIEIRRLTSGTRARCVVMNGATTTYGATDYTLGDSTSYRYYIVRVEHDTASSYDIYLDVYNGSPVFNNTVSAGLPTGVTAAYASSAIDINSTGEPSANRVLYAIDFMLEEL